MGLIIAILLGAFVGYIASALMGRESGFWFSVLIGVVGAFIGGILGVGDQAILAFDLSGLLWSLGGSIVFVAILNALQKRN